MPDTYKTREDERADKAQQLTLLDALKASPSAIQLDECRAWTIFGRETSEAMGRLPGGHISTWGDGKTWLLYVRCRSPRLWTSAKQKLAFCKATQNGDDEGCLRLFALPTPEEADAIRDVLGIRRALTESSLEKRRELARGMGFGAKNGKLSVTGDNPRPFSVAGNLAPKP